VLPEVIRLIGAGSLHPEAVTSQALPWDAADGAWPAMTGKTVFVRS
jgi:hypothetical protein